MTNNGIDRLKDWLEEKERERERDRYRDREIVWQIMG